MGLLDGFEMIMFWYVVAGKYVSLSGVLSMALSL